MIDPHRGGAPPDLLRQVLDSVAALAAEMRRLSDEMARRRGPDPRDPPPPDAAEQLVTLDQMAAIVNRQKSCLRVYLDRMPPPRHRGSRGRAALWAWPEVRPWLETTFDRALPARYPSRRA